MKHFADSIGMEWLREIMSDLFLMSRPPVPNDKSVHFNVFSLHLLKEDCVTETSQYYFVATHRWQWQ